MSSYTGILCIGPPGDGLHWHIMYRTPWGWPTLGGAVFADNSPIGRSPPPLRTRGIIDPLTCGVNVHRGLVVGVFPCLPTGRRFESVLCRSTFDFCPSAP